MKSVLALLTFFAVAFHLEAAPAKIDWMTSYEEALAKAKAEHKPVLLFFTGSDWCGWCKRLDREVFSQAAFQSFATANLVLVKIDFPKYVKQTEEEKNRNWKLAERYGVSGFPAILLVDATGVEKLRTGYIGGGPEQYVQHLKAGM